MMSEVRVLGTMCSTLYSGISLQLKQYDIV